MPRPTRSTRENIFTAIMTKDESNTLLYMETNYLILLDYSVGELIKIRLTEQEKIESESYQDYEEFIYTLEDKYNFRLSNCSWMCCEVLSERSY